VNKADQPEETPNPSQPPLIRGGADRGGAAIPPDKGGARGVLRNITKDELCQLVPHSGAMCLLDEVVGWDEDQILCLASNHQDPANPLRHEGRLPALCAIEYAAQAMAVHGGLTARKNQGKPRAGFLGSVRDLKLFADYLDDIAAPLEVRAIKQMADANNSLYELRVSVAGRELMTGRAAVFLQPGEEA
jgi:predicted hotdog family 3-hydroxylacyl-ACP dehydratase